MYKELHRSVFVRPEQLIGETVNLTPNLGVALYIDPSYQSNPVLEIAQLQLNRTRNVVNSFQEDRKLVTWDSKERDDFYAEAMRTNLLSKFLGVRRQHWAHVNAGVNLIFYDVASNVTSNLHQMATTPSNFAKEVDGSIIWKAISTTFNNEASIAENLLVSGLTPESASAVISGIFKAAEALPEVYRNPQKLQAVLDWGQAYSRELIKTGKTYGDYVNNVRLDTLQLQAAKDYFGPRMDDLEIIAVTPAPQSEVDILTNGERDPDDFAGYFAVRGHWYEGGHCKGILAPTDARREGFNIGPAYLRQYQNILNSMVQHAAHGARPMLGGITEDTKLPTSIDLPVELAEQRLGYLKQFNLADRYPDAFRELREIVTASSLQRPVDLSLFRDCSLRHPPALRFAENYDLTVIEKACAKALRHLEKAHCNPDSTERDIAKAELQANSYETWRQAHPDYEPADHPYQSQG